MTTTADNKSSKGGPDIKQLAERDLPNANFPGEAKIDFRIALEEKVHKEIQKHAKENKQVEICGVLVGKWGKDEKGPFVAISASIRGEAATNKFAEVTFTHDTWSKINAEMDKSYAGYNIVGWYHTHPDFGIFLSDRDRFIHENFFSEPGQVAYVVDPIRDIEGFFIWQGGKPVPAPYYWAGDKIRMAPAEKDPRAMKHDDKRSSSSDRAGRDDPPPMDGGPLTWITLLLGALCCGMLGFMINGFMVNSQVTRLVEAVSLAQQVDRVRLAHDMEEAMQSVQGAAIALNSAQSGLQGSPPQTQAAFREAAMQFNLAAQQLLILRRQYGLDPRELGRLATILAQKQSEIDAVMNPTTNPSGGAGGPGGAASAMEGRTASTMPSASGSVAASQPAAAPTSAPAK